MGQGITGVRPDRPKPVPQPPLVRVEDDGWPPGPPSWFAMLFIVACSVTGIMLGLMCTS